jgi:predicted flap endonuclease-1-like 5' DNA nuclease
VTNQDQQASDLPKLSAPALRALHAAGCTRLDQVARLSEAEIKRLHGMGPTGIEQLRRALAAKGLSFANGKSSPRNG